MVATCIGDSIDVSQPGNLPWVVGAVSLPCPSPCTKADLAKLRVFAAVD
jgi:hypothetical protein